MPSLVIPLLRDAEGRDRMGRAAASFGTLDGTEKLLALADRARAAAGAAPFDA
ncbi:hypothetical protein [Agromyces cerinus]|uniref:hypothetical protein n=1 Tax=Agromyces cerinus TaxID=33878 RepID=UPI0013565052|nr:hypothetical protein [Agromyces cerinus]